MKLTDEMKKFVKEELAYIATAGNDGLPNVGPKRTMRVLDDNRLIYCENTGGRHYKNIQENGNISVCFIKRDDNLGFRFEGKATSYTDDEHMNLANEVVGVKPKKACVIIDIEKYYTMSSGPLAGKLIEE